ncbi:MAG: hypothetical protein ABMA64_43200 [Myxococcota bacterium]
MPGELAPVHDSWRIWSHAGSWTYALRAADGDNAANGALVGQLLAALDGFARPRWAILDGGPTDGWSDEVTTSDPHAVAHAIARAPVPVQSAQVRLDLLAWARQRPDGPPELGWMRDLADLDLALEPDGYVALWLGHTLFVPGNLNGPPNDTLYALNAPLLADALATLAARGPLVDASGLDGVGPTGFTERR